MRFFNINHPQQFAGFREATLQGQAAGKGLYFPEQVPQHTAGFFKELRFLSKTEIGMRVLQPYAGDSIPEPILADIIAHTINFNFPLIPVHQDLFALELFHGPTLAFKDVGARFMSRCLGYFSTGNARRTTVLVATSGDTGGAVADGFAGIEGVEVIILYPAGKVSAVQELQLTTCGGNITALKVAGSFDDCQQLVKQAFADENLQQSYTLTSANSINIARWLPQQLYYFYALQQWMQDEPPVIAVPSGNLGNLAAGLLAAQSGLPVRHFIAACNVNDTVPAYLENGRYTEKASIATYSNAMDVGAPSNFVRILQLFNYDHNKIQEHISGYSITDAATLQCIRHTYDEYHYLPDPHGAVGIAALEQYLASHPGTKGIFLATAHPVKFPAVIEEELGILVVSPPGIETIFSREKQAVDMPANFDNLKEWLLHRQP